MSGQSLVAPVGNSNAQSAQSSQAIWQDHSFATTALTTFKKLTSFFSRDKKQYTLLKDRKAQFANSQQATDQQKTRINDIITGLKSNNTNDALGNLKDTLDTIPNGEITLEQALGIIDGALRSNIGTKTALLSMLLETAQSNKDTTNQITEFFSYILTDGTSNFPDEIKQQAITALFQNENGALSEIRNGIFGKYDDNNKMPEPLLEILKNVLFEEPKENNDDNQDGIELSTCESNENFLEELKNSKPWAIQVYAHALKNDDYLLNKLKLKLHKTEIDTFQKDTLLYCLRNDHEWAKNTVNGDKRLASQVADTIKNNLESNVKSTQSESISLLKNIIHSSEEIPELALKLLVGAANQTETSVASVNQATVKQFPDWLSEVMRGIKPDAFKKIAEQIVNCDKNQWKDLTGTDENAPENGTDSADKNIPDKLDTIATLALAALPEDDSKINKNCTPFPVLSELLSITTQKRENIGPNIVAHIGKALVDADCNNPTWTNSRTTAFLKALNAINSTKTQEGLGKSLSEMAKDALLSCRSKLEGNAYKFDVAIQYVADDESEQKQEKDKKESSAQNPTPITSFFVDCLSPAEEYKSIIADIQSFQNYTGEPLYQFKPQTYEHIKNAMIMNHARKAYAFKKYQEYKGKQEASPNDDGIELDDQTIPTHSGEVEEKMGNDFNTWYNENKENIAGDFNTWYSENKDGITTRLNSASDDIQNENTKVDIDGITLDRSSFQDQLQYLGRIDKSRYPTLSDEHIQEVTNNILSLARDGKVQAELTNNNLFKSNYILEKSCSQLLTYLSNAENDQTKAHAKTALETILKYYYGDDKTYSNDGKIKDATDKFIKTLHSHNYSIKEIKVRIHEGLTNPSPLQNPDDPAAKLFTNNRELKGVSGHSNNCLFYSICGQKQGKDNDKYNSYELRQKYVEIQKAGQEISKEEEQRFQTEQAEISCLSQMATHLKRPIVVLVEQTATNQKGTGILLYLPNTEILLPPLSAENLDNNTTIETWLGNYNNHDAEFNALAIALKTKVDDVKTMNVETALEILLGDSNTIALHFQGDTQNGHYQSFVPKKQEDEYDFDGFGNLFE